MLAVGLMLGAGATTVLRAPLQASAQAAMSGSRMAMPAKSPGDVEMNAAMSRMMRDLAQAKLTGDQDRDFMTMMIAHHESAVAMAKVELRRGKHAELLALAHDVISSQNREIAHMQAWLRAWYGRSQ